MSVTSPQPGWWNSPLHKEEKIWITIAAVWCVFITLAMPWWHIFGTQNSSQEYYTINPDDYGTVVDKFIEQYTVGEEAGIPVVAPPAGAEIFLRGQQWMWDPILKLKKGETYRLHLSSMDVLHAMSIYPINMNFEVVPGWDYVLTLTPTTSGEFNIICNEFCGIGHHSMIGKIYVES
ncbi:MAG: cytochrome C oxidase subunit II [Nitrospinae bacterium]|nr:cytochrome C oxidase subunit II [Nitrospinota bacterium]